MYRKIMFRAKTLKDNYWAFGDLNLNTSVHPHIHTGLFSKENIKQGTISQSTGIKDMHMVEIYEDDIVEWTDDENKVHRDVVTYTNGGFYPLFIQRIENNRVKNLKKIGDIYTHPNLLENVSKE